MQKPLSVRQISSLRQEHIFVSPLRINHTQASLHVLLSVRQIASHHQEHFVCFPFMEKPY